MIKIKFGVALPNYGHRADRSTILQIARRADELGYFSVWVAERLIVPEPPNQPWSKINPSAYEPLVTLSFLSSVIEKVRLGTAILVLPFRNPLMVARQVATLDVLSRGRLILGVGAGWMEEEFQAAGVPIKERGARTDEALQLLRELWEKPKPKFEGRFTRFPEIHFKPKPLQRRLPIWIGGNSPAALRRVARLGDGWLPMGQMGFEEIHEKIGTIRKSAKKFGRPMDDITISYSPTLDHFKGSTEAFKKNLEKYIELGVVHFVPTFSYETAQDLINQMKLFATEIFPSFQ